METETLAMAQEIDFSFLALFLRATLTVKLVMLLLMVASFWSWSIIITKLFAYRKTRAEAEVFDRDFWSGEPLDELFDKIGSAPDGPAEKVFAAGMMEWRRSHREDGGLIAGAQARIDPDSQEARVIARPVGAPCGCDREGSAVRAASRFARAGGRTRER